MTVPRWKVALEDLGLSAPTPTDPPAGESGTWFNAQTRFERRGFVRILVKEGDVLRWSVEAAHPALTTDVLDLAIAALSAQSDGDWTYDETEDAHYTITGEATEDRVRETIVPLLLFADAVAADRDHLGDLSERLTAQAERDDQLKLGEEVPERGSSDEPDESIQSDDSSQSGESEPEQGEESEKLTGSPFEAIGSEEPQPVAEHAVFEIAVTSDHIEVGMGLPYALDAATYDEVVAAWSRSLRGRYDVTASPLQPDATRSIVLGDSASRVMLVVKPDALTGNATIDDVAPDLHDHIDTLEKVASAGIDPLVFLGVRERGSSASNDRDVRAADRSGRGPFETIGDSSSNADDSLQGDDEELGDEGSGVLLVEADPEDDEPGGLILDLSAPPADGDALQRGKFDDPRLQVSDATTRLVDVVLRHPGYSDRRIGQVLSILLSVDYSDALELADSAPRVIAWGVGNERGNTMKTVIEGAGGKVVLVEPDTFAPR